jgi:hypothetical protein
MKNNHQMLARNILFPSQQFKLTSLIIILLMVGGINSYAVDSAKTTSNSKASAESVQQNERTITGKVVDASGESIPSVNVIVKGTTIGVITDIDGNFSINVPSVATTLVVSFIGMKTVEVPIESTRTNYDVVLEDTINDLDEIVVVGF